MPEAPTLGATIYDVAVAALLAINTVVTGLIALRQHRRRFPPPPEVYGSRPPPDWDPAPPHRAPP